VRAFARPDAEIAQDIRDDAFRGLALPEQIAVEVREGAVTLHGEVESRYDAEVVPHLVRRIPGVVAVDSELTAWDGERHRKVVVTAHRS
jgi:osmotically-inducible protein OsmY